MVRVLAAARAQLRQGPLRDERTAAPRPAPSAAGATAMKTGPWLRLLSLASTAGVALVVSTGAWALAHDVTANVTLALLFAVVLAARIAHPDRPDLFAAALAAFLLFAAAGVAGLLGAPALVHLSVGALALAAASVSAAATFR